ncbi:molybdopterin molybdotransferase MoeA [Buchananella hordeovulneris]|uniref:molybdopterin molybdotransferase MoeA n=1 Tax=Buchananella hordeovulneris TaxID=52770 RepID=UPI000F5F4549|nr:gephyrin-like molybdotransferase Glp [Buchananella hordeovulneris]MDO5081465.1 molybdopterin molybdotransferase MoeA [Buchananella hordeovulneris]RRD44273.1 molybdopterin molybdenumtransferase MoeA [Buchananella hordeovulneris]
MKTVGEHIEASLQAVGPQPPLEVGLPDAVGCILAEDVLAPFDLPFTDVAALDGYAVHAADLQDPGPDGTVELKVLCTVLAGSAEHVRLVRGAAVAIASGAPLPKGADTVIPVEDTDRGVVNVQIRSRARVGDNIKPRAADVRAGSVVLARGERVGARQVALLAGVGRVRVAVHPRPRVVIVSIGDELVEPGGKAVPGKVFDANVHALATAAQDAGATTFRVSAVPDERGSLMDLLRDQLVRADLVITTGGLSYGEGDTVKDVLAPLGTVRFDNVAISPGRQLGVGTLGDGVALFALPGDPVAAQVAFEVFVRPALRKMAGRQELFRRSVQATVARGWTSPAGRVEFARVALTGDPAHGYTAELQGEPQALLLSALARSNAFAVVPEAITQVRAGDKLHCLVLEDD